MNVWQCTLSKNGAPTMFIDARTFTCQADELPDLADNENELAHLLNMQPGEIFHDRAGDRWKRLS